MFETVKVFLRNDFTHLVVLQFSINLRLDFYFDSVCHTQCHNIVVARVFLSDKDIVDDALRIHLAFSF